MGGTYSFYSFAQMLEEVIDYGDMLKSNAYVNADT